MEKQVNRIDFGKLVAALRREVRDANDLSWSQRRLGEEAGLGEAAVGKIERGERTTLDPETLVSLANALRLTSGERKEFFLASTGVADPSIPRMQSNPKEILDEIRGMMERPELPSFVLDSYGDFVIANSAVVKLCDIPPEVIAASKDSPAGFSLMRLLFAPEFGRIRAAFGQRWSMVATYNLAFFRCITLRYRFTDHFTQVLAHLRTYPLFRRFWQQVQFEVEDHYLGARYYEYESPDLGPVSYFATLTPALTTAGCLYLVTYMPCNTRTCDMFSRLVTSKGMTVLPLARWPK